ncbi:hypothetical protein Q7P37_008828 [Cladosporium fusiforme]
MSKLCLPFLGAGFGLWEDTEIMSTSRSSSRNKKRSTTNLADLRLAPLSTRFVPDNNKPQHGGVPRSPYEEAANVTFARHHPTYMQGRSAPTSPGILSRSSSRRHLGGGLSRRGSLYDDTVPASDVTIVYPTSAREEVLQIRKEGGGMPKAKSEAALGLGHQNQQRLSGYGVQLSQKRLAPPRSKSGSPNTPRVRSKMRLATNTEEDWLSHANNTTKALLGEARGQTFLSSSNSATALALPSSDEDDEDDEGYEELAATAHLSSPHRAGTLSPSSPTMNRWGSRFGSRSGSRRTSRRGSLTNLRTPLATTNIEGAASYFDSIGGADLRDAGPNLIAEESEDDADAGAANDEADEAELKHLAQNPAIGFGGIFERIAGVGWFAGGDSEESGQETELEGEDGKRRAMPPPPPPPVPGEDGQRVGLWEDAAWLLSIAGRALT